MDNKFTFPMRRPHLTIELVKQGSLGKNYSFADWKVTSSHRLTKQALVKLNEIGVLGVGQEFGVTSRCDGKEEPAEFDEVECVEVDRDGNSLPGPAVNPYSNEPYKPHTYGYFVYLCTSRCDSGD